MWRHSYDRFAVALLSVSLAVAAEGAPDAASPAKRTFGDVSFPTPDAQHWRAAVRDENLVFTSLDAAAPHWAQMTVFASQDLAGDSTAFQQAFAKAMSRDLALRGVTKLGDVTPPEASSPAEGVEILKRVATAQGEKTNQHNLYVAIHAGNRFELIAYQTDGQATFDKFIGDAQKLFQSINIALPDNAAARADANAARADANAARADANAARADAHAAPREQPAKPAQGGGFGAMLRAVKPDALGAADGAAPAKIPAAVLGERQLDGLFRYQRTTTILSSDMRRMIPFLEVRHFYFFPDGHVYFDFPAGGNVKEHPAAADFAAFAKSDPEECGSYVIAKGKITLTKPGPNGQSQYSFKLATPADGTALDFDGGLVVKLFPFKGGGRLSGSYANDQVVAAPLDGSTAFVVSGLSFSANGTVSSNGWVGVDRSDPLSVSTNGSGTYELSAYQLKLVIGGETRTATICQYDREAKGQSPDTLFIDGHVYRLKK